VKLFSREEVKSVEKWRTAKNSNNNIRAAGRVARFFLVQHTKTGKMYQISKNTSDGHKKYQIAIK
jgi:hypothetical protein